jgi:hypothetical protein
MLEMKQGVEISTSNEVDYKIEFILAEPDSVDGQEKSYC